MALTKEDLLAIQQLLQPNFEKIDQRFEKIDQRFEKIDQRFEKIDQRFEKIDQRFEKIEQERRIWSKQFAIKRLQERQEDRDFTVNQLKKLKAKFI